MSQREIARKRDWRIAFGVVVTLLWLAGGTAYIVMAARQPGVAFTPDIVGGFLEGAFAPLAFLWLVIGLFIQQRELAAHAESLRRTSEQSEKQTQAIAATELNARQETFFKIKDNVSRQLGGIAGMLYSSSMGPAGSGQMTESQMAERFQQVAAGDCEVFARLFLTADYLRDTDLGELFYGTGIRAGHTENYLRTFERLRRLARNCDVDGIIEDSLMQNAFGLLYRRMQAAKPVADRASG